MLVNEARSWCAAGTTIYGVTLEMLPPFPVDEHHLLRDARAWHAVHTAELPNVQNLLYESESSPSGGLGGARPKRRSPCALRIFTETAPEFCQHHPSAILDTGATFPRLRASAKRCTRAWKCARRPRNRKHSSAF